MYWLQNILKRILLRKVLKLKFTPVVMAVLSKTCITSTFGWWSWCRPFPHFVLEFPAGALSGDDLHLLQQGDDDHCLYQHSPFGRERVHVAYTSVCCTLS